MEHNTIPLSLRKGLKILCLESLSASKLVNYSFHSAFWVPKNIFNKLMVESVSYSMLSCTIFKLGFSAFFDNLPDQFGFIMDSTPR